MQSALYPEMHFDPVSANGTRISTDLVRASLHTITYMIIIIIITRSIIVTATYVPYILSVFSV